MIESITKDILLEKEKFEKDSISTSVVRDICRKYYKKIKGFKKEEIYEICERLLEFKEWQKRTIAFEFAFRIKQYDEDDYNIFYKWLNNYVTGWGSCDDLCTHAFGLYVFQYPNCISNINEWTESNNCWIRRAAAVVLIYSIRRGRLFKESLEIANKLLLDEHDLVRKGYGWMLKEISNKDPDLIFNFVMERKEIMPRVSLRYAIEKLNSKLRKEVMN